VESPGSPCGDTESLHAVLRHRTTSANDLARTVVRRPESVAPGLPGP